MACGTCGNAPFCGSGRLGCLLGCEEPVLFPEPAWRCAEGKHLSN